jgi:hypothetical protein
MNHIPNSSIIPRTLFIDFDLHTEGDTDFKEELVEHMISNLFELQRELKSACASNNPDVFKASVHKVHTTISMLHDPALTRVIDEIKTHFGKKSIDQNVREFNFLCAVIIRSLELEKNSFSRYDPDDNRRQKNRNQLP